MGSGTRIDLNEASSILSVTKGQVSRYIRQGMLRPYYPKGRRLNAPVLLDKEEVSALAEVREKHGFDVRSVALQATQALAASRQMERRVERLERALGGKFKSLPLDEEGAISVYSRALEEQQFPRSDIDGVMYWAEIFIAMGEEFLDVLEAYTEDEACWKVFTDLGQSMALSAPHEQLVYDVELKAAYGYLDVGRRNLRNVAFLYTRSRFGSRVANEKFNSIEECHEQILAILATNW